MKKTLLYVLWHNKILIKQSRHLKLVVMLLLISYLQASAKSGFREGYPSLTTNNTGVDQIPGKTFHSVERVIQGKIVDENGNPIEGASVKVRGTDQGTI